MKSAEYTHTIEFEYNGKQVKVENYKEEHIGEGKYRQAVKGMSYFSRVFVDGENICRSHFIPKNGNSNAKRFLYNSGVNAIKQVVDMMLN